MARALVMRVDKELANRLPIDDDIAAVKRLPSSERPKCDTDETLRLPDQWSSTSTTRAFVFGSLCSGKPFLSVPRMEIVSISGPEVVAF